MDAASAYNFTTISTCTYRLAGQDDIALDTKLLNIRQVVHDVPRIHFDLLKRLIEHLDKYV